MYCKSMLAFHTWWHLDYRCWSRIQMAFYDNTFHIFSPQCWFLAVTTCPLCSPPWVCLIAMLASSALALHQHAGWSSCALLAWFFSNEFVSLIWILGRIAHLLKVFVTEDVNWLLTFPRSNCKHIGFHCVFSSAWSCHKAIIAVELDGDSSWFSMNSLSCSSVLNSGWSSFWFANDWLVARWSILTPAGVLWDVFKMPTSRLMVGTWISTWSLSASPWTWYWGILMITFSLREMMPDWCNTI